MAFFGILALTCASSLRVPGQQIGGAAYERAELSRRLLRAEEAWARFPKRHAMAIPALNAAVGAYFGRGGVEAARQLDAASGVLWDDGDDPGAVWSRSRSVLPVPSLVDRARFTRSEARIRIAPLYDPRLGDAHGKLLMTVSAGSRSTCLAEPLAYDTREIDVLLVSGDAKPVNRSAKRQEFVLPIDLPAGDVDLTVTLAVPPPSSPTPADPDGMHGRFATLNVGVVDRLEERLTSLESAADDATDPDVGATLALRVQILRDLASGKPGETLLQSASLLERTEVLAKRASASDAMRGLVGDQLVAGPRGRRTRDVTRVLVPDGRPADTPLPLVIAVHGTGGSENMFFEAYDRGHVARSSRERGWMLAAPRGPVSMSTRHIDEALRLAARLHAVDRRRVFLIGHSLGAGQVAAAAALAPQRFAAVALVSGGLLTGVSPGPKDLPTFVGIGADDPLFGARRTAASRPESYPGSQPALRVDRVYPNVEHVMIMHECLDDVMEFFDRVAKL